MLIPTTIFPLSSVSSLGPDKPMVLKGEGLKNGKLIAFNGRIVWSF